jgi:hypothetical protein
MALSRYGRRFCGSTFRTVLAWFQVVANSMYHCGEHRGAAFIIEPSYACLVFDCEKFG